MIAIGLMSGTSLDGIDAALVRIEPRGNNYDFELLQFRTVPFEGELATALRAAVAPAAVSMAEIAALHVALGHAFARAAHSVAGAMRVDFIASHGQTVFHDGSAHVTLQFGDPFVIRETMCATVCYDFRSADCAVGGHGAPLVPYVDALVLASDLEDRVALNVGGIANITALQRGTLPHDVMAFDTGPGNMLLDAFTRERTNGVMNMDEDGRFAAMGSVDEALLDAMLADPYFLMEPPKTTGRERFGAQFLRAHAERLDALSIEDGCATLTELTAVSVARGVALTGLDGARVYVSGGGAKNSALMWRLQARLRHRRVEPSDAMGIPSDAKEAIAFAILGYETLRERAANVPRVTGASRAVPLGAIAPFDFERLSERVRTECRAS